jgi:hypothetical protein
VKPEKYHVMRMEEIKFQGISEDKNEIVSYKEDL